VDLAAADTLRGSGDSGEHAADESSPRCCEARAAVNRTGDSGVTTLIDAAFNSHASWAEQEGHKSAVALLWKR